MKLHNLLIITLFGAFFLIVACGNKKEDPTTEQTTLSPDAGIVAQDPSAVTASQTSGGTELHYKCPKNCEGGGGDAQGKCPVCGTELVHNQAFHSQAPATPGSSPQTPIQVTPTNQTGDATAQQTAAPPAAQNAQGLWHFTCSKGCAGGAGVAGNCAKCGNPLAHNPAFHTQ